MRVLRPFWPPKETRRSRSLWRGLAKSLLIALLVAGLLGYLIDPAMADPGELDTTFGAPNSYVVTAAGNGPGWRRLPQGSGRKSGYMTSYMGRLCPE